MFIGEYLKQIRIKNKIALPTVSRELNISFVYLEAIENDEFSNTPGGVYTIGFIRAYANYLNLDSNEIINKYKTQLSLSETPEPIKLPKPVETFFPPTKMISLLAVISISIVFYFMFIDRSDYLQSEYALTPKIPEYLQSEIEEYEVEIALSQLKKFNKETVIEHNDISEVKLLKETDKIVQESQLVAVASKPADSVNDELMNIISLKAINSTWIQLRNINNEIVYSKLMDMNDIYNYSLKDNFVITTGNAGNIIVSIGGEVMGKLGKKGEVLDLISISPDYFID